MSVLERSPKDPNAGDIPPYAEIAHELPANKLVLESLFRAGGIHYAGVNGGPNPFAHKRPWRCLVQYWG